MIQTLQSLRFVFVMLIFLSHFSYKDIQFLDAGGDCGVAFFFLLSGFVCSLGYKRQLEEGTFSYRGFLKRRAVKVYPLHLLCLAIFLVISHSAIDGKVLLNVLLLQSWIPDPSWYFSCNSVAWFLSSLLFCYLLFPFAYRHASVYGLLFILAVYAFVCWIVPYDKVNAILYVHPMVRFVDFYIGVVISKFYERHRGHEKFSSWMEWGLMILLMVLIAVYPFTDAKLRNAPMYWMVLVPMIMVFADAKGPVSRLLSARPLLWLGSLSMPIFLTHQMLIGILLHRLPDMPSPLMLFACIAIVLFASWGIQKIILQFSRL